MLWKNRVVVNLAAAGAVSAAAFGGVAAATGGASPATASPVAASAVDAVASEESTDAPARLGQGGVQTVQLNEDGERQRGPRGGGEIAEFLGITSEELREQLQAGATPAEVASANGSSGASLIAFMLGEAQTRLDEAVANGDVSQADVDERLTRITERVTTFVNEGPQEGERPHRGHRGPRVLGAAAEVIGIEPQAVVEGIRAGGTVADVAAANGSSGQAVVDALVAAASERIDQAVADGRMTAEEGAEKLAGVGERINTFVFETPELPERGERQGRGGPPSAGNAPDGNAAGDF